MNVDLFFKYLFGAIALYYLVKITIYALRRQSRKPLCPIETFEDPILGTLKIKMEQPDDWEWSIPIVIRHDHVDLRIDGDEKPDEQILVNARRVISSLDQIAAVVEASAHKTLSQKVRQYTAVQFPSKETPKLFWVRFLATDDTEYECTLDCSRNFSVFAEPSPF